jgi:hypothetical protein
MGGYHRYPDFVTKLKQSICRSRAGRRIRWRLARSFQPRSAPVATVGALANVSMTCLGPSVLTSVANQWSQQPNCGVFEGIISVHDYRHNQAPVIQDPARSAIAESTR